MYVGVSSQRHTHITSLYPSNNHSNVTLNILHSRTRHTGTKISVCCNASCISRARGYLQDISQLQIVDARTSRERCTFLRSRCLKSFASSSCILDSQHHVCVSILCVLSSTFASSCFETRFFFQGRRGCSLQTRT